MTTQTKLETTASSTAADDAERQRRLGSVLWLKTKKLLDDLDRLKPDPDHARASRTADLEQRIEGAIAEKLATLETQHQRFRTSTVINYLRRCEHKPPTREVVQRVLRKHGLYT